MAVQPKNTTKATKPRKPSSKKVVEPITTAEVVAAPVVAPIAPLEVPEHRSRCGGALRTQREKLGLTVQEVASRMRLSPKQVDALEVDDFDALPEATITRGFIRNYAKLLKMNVEPVIDAYNVLVPSKAPHSLTLKATSEVNNAPSITGFQRLLKPFLVLVLGALLWWFYHAFIQKPSPVEPTASELPAPEILPEAALPAAERNNSDVSLSAPSVPATGAVPVATTPPEAAATAAAASSPTAPPASPAAAAEVLPTPALAPSAAIEPSLPAGQSKLEFSATQETWINIVDSKGKEIFSKILFPGNREVIVAAPPLNVTIGNAGGTNLQVNGKATDLAPHTRVNVAHVKVE